MDPAEAALRLHFSGTALIADCRFPEQRDGLWPDELVARGQALYENGSVEERPVFGHSVLLLLYSASGEDRDVEVTLARQDTEADTLLEDGTASPPFFVGENDALRLLVDGRQELLALPPKLWKKVISVRLKNNPAGLCFLQVRSATDDEPGSLLPLRLCVNGKEKP